MATIDQPPKASKPTRTLSKRAKGKPTSTVSFREPKAPLAKRGPGRPLGSTKFTSEEIGERHREASNRYQTKARVAAREIGPLDTSNILWDLRKDCKLNLEKFGVEYFPAVIYLGISQDHKRVIAKMERAILQGGKFALAMPRGQGKTAWCRIAMIWGSAYGHSRFPYFVGSKAEKAEESLDFLKHYWNSSPFLIRDFPEIAYPISKLENRFHQAAGQLFDGELTHIIWHTEQVRYPCCLLTQEAVQPYLDNDPESVFYIPSKDRWMAKSGGCLIKVTGIDGSIRGEAEVHPVTLEQVRPDIVLLDDIQKDQRADSPTSVEKLVKMVDGAVQGLAGPDRMLSVVMPCTVQAVGDLSTTFLDRSKKPEYQGERCKLVTQWPAGIDDFEISMDTPSGKLWNQYGELRKQSLLAIGDISLATEYYLLHQAGMDANFEVSWVDRFNASERYAGNKEVSAQQSAMNKRFEGPITFSAEFQNNPRGSDDLSLILITPGQLAERTISLPRYVVPGDTHTIVCYVDVQNEVFYYTVLAVNIHFSGNFVDYGTWPSPAGVRYFRKFQTEGWNMLSREFFNTYPQLRAKAEITEGGKVRAPLEAKIYYGCNRMVDMLLQRDYIHADFGTPMKISKIAIDTRWGKVSDAIKRFVQEKGNPNIVPSMGQGVTPAHKQYEEYDRTRGWLFEDQVHPGIQECKWIWRPAKDGMFYLSLDVNRLKTFLMSRLASPLGSPGSITLFDASADDHQMFADSVAGSEYPILTTARGRGKEMWEPRDGRPDNDYLDCSAGCMALASMMGARWLPQVALPPAPRRKLSDIWAAKHGSRVS